MSNDNDTRGQQTGPKPHSFFQTVQEEPETVLAPIEL